VATGDILRVRVIETAGSQALLKLSDGTVLNASLLQTLNFKPGELVDFMVTGRSGDRLILETLKNKNDVQYINEQRNTIGNELKLLDIRVSNETLDAAVALKNAGFDVSLDVLNRVSEGVKSFSGLTAEEAAFLLSTGLDINEENVSALLQLTRDSYKIGDKLQELNKLFQTLNGILDGQEQAKSFSRAALDKIFLKSENGLSSDEIIKAYNSILESLHSAKQLLAQHTVAGGNEILARLDNLQNNIRFINELSSYCSYLQIPVSLQQQNTTAQLYVMKKNKSSHNIDPENATLYISLDTLNMGQVDSLIRVEKMTVSLNLRAETPDVVSFFKNSAGIIYNMLQNQGYRLVDYRCSIIERPASIINVADILQCEYGMRKRTIDYRL
jgi:hypothetical protein